VGGTSRMRREPHVRSCERLGVKFPGPTRQLVGDYKNAGSDYRPEGCPDKVKVHDFVDAELGKVIP
jgi:hypothetical protein